MKLMMLFIFYLCLSLRAQNLDGLIEKVYRQALVQDSLLQNLRDYSYRQKIEFRKLDGDDEIEEQSRTEFELFARGVDLRKRVLIRAENFEDGEWHDITDEKKSEKEETQSKEFSLSEIVSPENRKDYLFTFIGRETIEGDDVDHIRAESRIEDEERFNADLWIHAREFVMIKGSLVPSDFPTGLKSMRMEFVMKKYGQVLLPVRIELYAEISFLLIFSGKIESVITFEEYKFEQNFDPQFFN